MSHRVVITGVGAISACGNTADRTFESMRMGRSGIAEIQSFDATGLKCQVAAEVKDYDAETVLGRRMARRLGRFSQFAFVAGDEAMACAGFKMDWLSEKNTKGLRPNQWPEPERFGVYVGSGIGGFPEIVAEAHHIKEEGIRRVSPLFVPRVLINLAGGQLSIRYGALGPSMSPATACAAGNHAIGEAFYSISTGRADVILAGGAEASITPLSVGGFMNMGALSKHKAPWFNASRPFSKTRNGFVMGEGAGILVLERLEHAQARGASIMAEIVGYATTTDGHHVTAPDPEGRGASRCMSLAIQKANLAPEEVDYINAHGTSTPLNDVLETRAIRRVFGRHGDQLVVSSTKGVTGHLLGASGGIEAVASVKAITTGWVPPTAHLDEPDPECDLDYVPNEGRQIFPRVVVSNAFGFGGTNAVLVFKKWEN